MAAAGESLVAATRCVTRDSRGERCDRRAFTGVAVTFQVARLPFGQIESSMTLTSAVNDRELTVTGATNLVDGSRISCDLWPDGEAINVGPATYYEDDETIVAAGAFTCRADLTSWPPGVVQAHAYFRQDVWIDD
ncbi:MAG: hypothetical protein ACREMY_06985 [bacterium]